MQVSDRISGITGGGSDGWGLFLRARAMIASGVAVTELTIGEHDITTHPDILNAMNTAALDGATGYAMVPGIQDLREEIAARVQAQSGVQTDADNIIVTPGGQAALFAAHIAVCDPDDVALYLDPYYATYPGTLRGAGAVARAIQTDPNDMFKPRAADIDAHADDAKSILINSPNNPTGVVYDRETLQGIADVAQARDLWVISDEVYDTQIWEGSHISIRALDNMKERTLVVGSMSKSHAMTGSRIGWIVGPKDMIEHLINLATHTNYGVAGFVQHAALFALRQGDETEVAIAEPFRRRRELALNALKGQNIVRAVPPQGAMYVMLDIRATGLSGDDFADRLLDECRIAVMPGESFGQSAAGHIRVAMTVDDTAFSTAMDTLVAFAAKLV